MRTFVLTCGAVSIQYRARTIAEAFEHGFAELGQMGKGISCICQRPPSTPEAGDTTP